MMTFGLTWVLHSTGCVSSLQRAHHAAFDLQRATLKHVTLMCQACTPDAESMFIQAAMQIEQR